MSALLSVHGLHAARRLADGREEAVRGFSGEFFPARTYVLTNPHDGGKRLLWRLLTLLEPPHRGAIIFEGVDACALSADALAEVRNRRVGYLFSTPYLLPGFSVVENVAMPLFKVLGVDPPEAKGLTETALRIADLEGVADCAPDELSPLHQHLTALARAICFRPALLAVEELGRDLPVRDRERLAAACQRAVREYGLTALVTWPGADLAFGADATVQVFDGQTRDGVRTSDVP